MDSKYLSQRAKTELVAGVLAQAEFDQMVHSMNAQAGRIAGNDEYAAEQEKLAAMAKSRLESVEADYPAECASIADGVLYVDAVAAQEAQTAGEPT